MAMAVVPVEILRFLAYLLMQKNPIVIQGGVCELEAILQTTGYRQGDNLSPLLFAALFSNRPESILRNHSNVEVEMIL